MYVADIGTWADEDGAKMRVKVGALVITLSLSNRARLDLIKGLSSGGSEVSAELVITPLRLPADINELTEQSLNARKV